MQKFRKKFNRNRIVEAVQVNSENAELIADWCDGEVLEEISDVTEDQEARIIGVRVPFGPEGEVEALFGDFVMLADESFHVRSESAFLNRYEPVPGE